MKLLLPKDYIKKATKLITTAKYRVSIVSLIISDDEATHELIAALKDAAKRGVTVSVSADTFTYTEINGNFVPTHYYGKKIRTTTKMVRGLRRSGATFTWLGGLAIASFAGRTHSKWCVVDDTVFSFGGVNVYHVGINNTDYMLMARNKVLADALIKEHARIITSDKTLRPYHSHTLTLDRETSVLFDGGLFNNSIIYMRTLELLREAQHVTFVSQYCPTGKIARLIKTKPHHLYFNDGSQASFINRTIIRIGIRTSGLETEYTKPTYLHAKCAIFTMPDNTKVAISGSHNFGFGSTLLGTKEIAIETRNKSIIRSLETFIQKNVA